MGPNAIRHLHTTIAKRVNFLFAMIIIFYTILSRSGPFQAYPSILEPRITSHGSKRHEEIPYPQRDNPNQYYAIKTTLVHPLAFVSRAASGRNMLCIVHYELGSIDTLRILNLPSDVHVSLN